jgi:hypothetical protein
VSVSRRFRRLAAGAAIVAGLTGGLSSFAAHATGGTSSISGVAFQDMNRNGVQDAGEAAFSGVGVDVFDGNGAHVGYAVTDANGAYSLGGLSDGRFDVAYDVAAWWDIRANWVPTTTGGNLKPRVSVTLASTATVDFGFRPIVRSTSASAPISTFTGPSGLRVSSYDDVVTAKEVHDALAQGSLLGAEAASIRVAFDLNGSATTAFAAGTDSSGRYTTYSATSYMNYVSWLDTTDKVLFHEYGHAWSGYFAHLAQQDPTFGGYLQARGLADDSRLNTSVSWDPAEMIAEDYRQLFASPAAAAYPQMNQAIAPAASVPGLRDYLSTTFRQAVAAPAPAPAPAPVVVSGLAINPSPVKTTGTVSFTLSSPASVTVQILDAKGAVVRTLLQGSAGAGTSTATWDRKTSTGAKAVRGTYTATVRATDAAGQVATATKTFSVS